MREYDYVLLDVFTEHRLQGNPLAVFPDADGICDREMQAIAGELNLSETVFLLESRTAAARARIFTPRRELDFAGHPTVGSAAVINRNRPQSGRFTIDENVGPIEIEMTEEDGRELFWLTTPPIAFYETLESAFCAKLLGVTPEDVAATPPQFVSAGSPFLFVQLASPEAVDRAAIQHAHLSDALGSVNSVGTFVFARKEPESRTSFDVYSRMFAPQTGIPEDPATGGATGPLAAYMLRYGLLPNDARFTSEQGTKMGRRSILHVKISGDPGQPRIQVGGAAVFTARGRFTVSADDSR